MGFFDHFQESAQELNSYSGSEHQAKFSHELIAGAAAYEAEKAYEEHRAANGDPSSHSKAKEIVAGLAGAFADRMIETKGMDWIDKKKVEHQVHEHFQEQNAYGNY